MTRVLDVARRLAPRLVAASLVAVFLITAPWWGPRLLSHLSFFRVRRIEIYGRHYIQPDDVLTRLKVDTNASIWDDLDVLQRRVAAHPQVRAVTIARKLPGTLVVRIEENLPVAFVPTADGLRAVDADARPFPVDPSKVNMDLPVLPHADTALTHLLADLRGRSPELFDQISSVRREGRDELTFAFAAMTVRASSGVTADRLADIVPVEADLARRKVRVAELDLRYRDQVVARLQ